MTGPSSEDRRVEPSGWLAAVRDARAEGYAFFDWLSAVDETDAGETDGEETDGEETDGGEGLLGPGLEVVCHLWDVSGTGAGRGLRGVLLRTRVPVGAALPSITGVFRGAAWHERELAEMFGLEIEGYDDGTGLGLRPLLLPEGFEGNPLRKEFVLAARASKPWPGAKEPGEGSGASRRSPSRRRLLPPGVPDPSWGPRGG